MARSRRANKIVRLACFSPAISHWEIALRTENQLVSGGLKEAAWQVNAVLLFVDISGFTNLCTRLDIDALQMHINTYFGSLIQRVHRWGGDVLRFAGDAILCAWSLPEDVAPAALSLAVHAACRCGLALMQECDSYEIPEIATKLSVHAGLGVGPVCCFRVGTNDRWEFLITGDSMRQFAEAGLLAKHGELVCSPHAWVYLKDAFAAEPRGDNGCQWIRSVLATQPLAEADRRRLAAMGGEWALPSEQWEETEEELRRELRSVLLAGRFLSLQQRQMTHEALYSADHVRVLSAYVHQSARQAIDRDERGGERRLVVVAFAKIEGLRLEDGVAALPQLQGCLEVAMQCIRGKGGLLRQFILDDKGLILIWTFGLTTATFEDNAHRGISTAQSVSSALSKQSLRVRAGVTSGMAFCGLVGSKNRCEYGVMGPSVNLAARLMTMCESQGEELLCNDCLAQELASGSQRSGSFTLNPLPPMRVKGYAEEVIVYRLFKRPMANVYGLLSENLQLYALLRPKEQLAFANALWLESFSAGQLIVKHGECSDRLFIIVRGSAHIINPEHTDGADGDGDGAESRSTSHVLGVNDCFGELLLMFGQPSEVTVQANCDTECMVIDGATLSKVIEPVDQILARGEAQRRFPMVRRESLRLEGLRHPPFRKSHSTSDVAHRKSSLARANEVELLLNRVSAMLATNDFSLVMITGEPGSGKTHLLSDLRAECYERSLPLISCEAASYDEQLAPFTVLLRALLSTHFKYEGRFSVNKVASELQRLLADGFSIDCVEELMGETSSREGEKAHTQRHRLEHDLVAQLLISLMNRKPHAIVIDKAEKFTSLDWQVLSSLAASAPSCIVIMASRDLQTWCNGGEPAEFQRLKRSAGAARLRPTHSLQPAFFFSTLELLPLDAAATGDILCNAIGVNSLRPETIERLHEHCGGNPAYLLSLVSSLPTFDARLQVDEALLCSLSKLPTSVHEVVLAQLDRLPITHQTILKIASAISAGIGSRFERNVLVEIYPGSAADVDEAMQSPLLQQYLRPLENPSLDDPFFSAFSSVKHYVFKQPIVADIIYHLMLAAQRQRLHGQIASWYQSLYVWCTDAGANADDIISMLAYHSARSGNSEMAKRHLLAAGRMSSMRGLYAQAESWLRQCVDLCEPPPASEADWLISVEATVALAEKYSRYGVAAPDGFSSVSTLRQLHVKTTQAALSSSGAAGERARESLALVSHGLAWALIGMGSGGGGDDDQTVIAFFMHAIGLRRELKHLDLAAESSDGLAAYYVQCAKAAAAVAEEAKASAEKHSRGRDEAKAAAETAKVEAASAEQAKWHRYAHEALEMSMALRKEVSWSPQLASTLAIKGSLHLDTGEAQLARNDLIEAVQIYSTAFGLRHPQVADALDVLAEAYIKMGERERALSVATRVREIRTQLVAAGYHSTLARDGQHSGAPDLLTHGTRWRAAYERIRGTRAANGFPWRQVPSALESSAADARRFCESLLRARTGAPCTSSSELRAALEHSYPELGYYPMGLTLEIGGGLSEGNERLRSKVLGAMELAARLARGDPEVSGWAPALTALAAGCLGHSAAALDKLLTVLALSCICNIALLVSDAGVDINQISIVQPADILSNEDIYLPSLMRMDPPGQQQVCNLLEKALDVPRLRNGELSYCALRPLCHVAAELGCEQARMLLLSAVLLAQGADLLEAAQGGGVSVPSGLSSPSAVAGGGATAASGGRSHPEGGASSPSDGGGVGVSPLGGLSSPPEGGSTLERLAQTLQHQIEVLTPLADAAPDVEPRDALRDFWALLCSGERAGPCPDRLAAMRLHCMLHEWRTPAGDEPSLEDVLMATKRCGSAEWRTLTNELVPAAVAERPIVLIGASELLQACCHCSCRHADCSAPPGELPELADAITVGLTAMARLYRIARLSLERGGGHDGAAGARPAFKLLCGHVAKVFQACGHGHVRTSTFSTLRRNNHCALVVVESKTSVMIKDMLPRRSTNILGALTAVVLPTETAELNDLAEGSDAGVGAGAAGAPDEKPPAKPAPTPFIIMMSPGRDQNDELALILSRAMVDIGLIDIKAVIVSMGPAFARAKLARGTLDSLSLLDVPVAVGSVGNLKNEEDKEDKFTETVAATGYDYLVREPDEASAEALLLRAYEAAEPHSLVLCILSTMTDAASFIRSHESLFVAKTKNLVIYCGVAVDPTDEFLEPDKTAQTYIYDPDAADFVYRRCQELGVRLLVLGRQAAYANAVPFFIYDELAATGHPVALRLRESQRSSLEVLWVRCGLPDGHRHRQTLPTRCDRQWFAKIFCGGVNLKSLEEEGRDIWSSVTTIYLHLVIAMLAAHPTTLEVFFEVDVKTVRGRDHMMVGCGLDMGAEGGSSAIVRDSTKLCSFIMNALRHALSESTNHAKSFSRRVQRWVNPLPGQPGSAQSSA